MIVLDKHLLVLLYAKSEAATKLLHCCYCDKPVPTSDVHEDRVCARCDRKDISKRALYYLAIGAGHKKLYQIYGRNLNMAERCRMQLVIVLVFKEGSVEEFQDQNSDEGSQVRTTPVRIVTNNS